MPTTTFEDLILAFDAFTFAPLPSPTILTFDFLFLYSSILLNMGKIFSDLHIGEFKNLSTTITKENELRNTELRNINNLNNT